MYGTIPYPRKMIVFPELPKDVSLSLFYSAPHGIHMFNDCLEISNCLIVTILFENK